jgi:nucleoside phosphorylase
VLTAIILTAIPVEYVAVRAHLTDIKQELHPGGTLYEVGQFSTPEGSWRVGVAEIGAGNEGAAVEAERAISHFRPTVALFVGVAGGLKDVAIGDVVAATKVYGYESGKAKAAFEPRPDVGESSYNMEQQARAVARRRDWHGRIAVGRAGSSITWGDALPQALVAPIAAGPKVIASTRSPIYRFLRSFYGDAAAVEMEGRGFLKATHLNQQVHALIVRGISDQVKGKRQADAQGSQTVAAAHAAAFAFQVLAELRLSPVESQMTTAGRQSHTHATASSWLVDKVGELLRELARRDESSGGETQPASELAMTSLSSLSEPLPTLGDIDRLKETLRQEERLDEQEASIPDKNMRRLLAIFPALSGVPGGLHIIGPPDRQYNSLAWAFGDTLRWWELGVVGAYWPAGATDDPLEATVVALLRRSYVPCLSAEHQPGYEKVAVFMNDREQLTHLARQAGDGGWTSKLGESYLIYHSLLAWLEGEAYGTVRMIFRRSVPLLGSGQGANSPATLGDPNLDKLGP